MDDGDLSAEELLTLFDWTCSEILDSVAPLRSKRMKPLSEPWLNDFTRSLRSACRQAERRWKKVQVSFGVLQDTLGMYQRAVKTGKTEYFSHLVASNSQRPQVLNLMLLTLLLVVRALAVLRAGPPFAINSSRTHSETGVYILLKSIYYTLFITHFYNCHVI